MLQNYNKIHKEYDKVFTDAEIETAELDWIMVEITGKKRSQLPLSGNFSEQESQNILSAIKKRLKQIPLGYIFGQSEFYGRNFKVTNSVLIPRMDTEILIEEAITQIKTLAELRKKNVSVLDIGTGSGAIAITLQKETDANLTAIDVSERALAVAKENAKILGADVEFIKSNLFENLASKKFDIIVSNPPYIETATINSLQPEVKDHEPILALDGGEDGLDFYRKIIKEAPKHLNENGVIIFEIGYNQSQAVTNLLQSNFEDCKTIKDFGKNDRVVVAKLRRSIW